MLSFQIMIIVPTALTALLRSPLVVIQVLFYEQQAPNMIASKAFDKSVLLVDTHFFVKKWCAWLG